MFDKKKPLVAEETVGKCFFCLDFFIKEQLTLVNITPHPTSELLLRWCCRGCQKALREGTSFTRRMRDRSSGGSEIQEVVVVTEEELAAAEKLGIPLVRITNKLGGER